ncbi:hypothetical protein FOA52_006766 [Chlamydomonas sp. UWO 241]|nr:hypothetical protein FOA52_006766 [Chlamydomonas sp. UWO 241]
MNIVLPSSGARCPAVSMLPGAMRCLPSGPSGRVVSQRSLSSVHARAVVHANPCSTRRPHAVTCHAATLDESEPSTSAMEEPAAAVVVEEVSSTDEEENSQASKSARREQSAEELAEELLVEVARRRNFAIISHPDAGKTTLTEKLLLYGGAIQEAGEVKARRAAKSATSDWMELEKQRGISISSTALTFEYSGIQVNLLDTPGHQDFSEDTYRTLAAADNAVMLVDGAKGIEPQTRKLFEVARMRKLPIFTIVNKMDRPALNGFDIIEQLEKEFGLPVYPVNWPIGSGDRFCGVYHRPTKKVVYYEKGEKGNSRAAKVTEYELDDPILSKLIEEDLLAQLFEDIDLLEVLGDELDYEAVMRGEITPMFFASAQSNFGVELFLKEFIDKARRPATATTRAGDDLPPTSPQFTGLVFKLQANMDPRHRDKIAYVRVVSGKFEKGMRVKVARTGRVVTLAAPQRMFANERSTVLSGFAGDVIGLTNPGAFAIGDTLHTGSTVHFPPIPTFSPELFAYIRCAPSQRKPFNKAIEGLLGEGAVQVLYSTDEYKTDPLLAACGQLQFEVVQYRMKDEYGVDTTLDVIPFSIARWVKNGWSAVEAAGRLFNTVAVKDCYGRPVLLFKNQYGLDAVVGEAGAKLGELTPYSVPPEM